MRRELQGPKNEVINMYNLLVARHGKVKVIEPITEMPAEGVHKMVVEATDDESYTARGGCDLW